MALYSKYGVSPMGGCLPMLIQMPVFMALFFFVPNAIELRQQSFLWAPDLSTYDDIINWGNQHSSAGQSFKPLLFAVQYHQYSEHHVHHEAAGYGTTANAGYETNDVYHASHVYFHLQRLFIRLELLLLHFRTDWYPHYGDSAQNN